MTFQKVEYIGDCTLYLGDCMCVIPRLAPVDVVLSDPPYETHMHKAKSGSRGIRKDGYESPKPLDFSSIGSMRGEIMPMLAELCGGWLVVFCTPEGVAAWRDEIESCGLRYKRACTWVKPDSAPQFNGQGPAMGAEMIVTAWCGNGHSKWNGGGRRGVFTHNTNSKDRHGLHPTEKPIALMRELVGLFSNENDVVLDPFMGSGTTGVACAKMGRKFIGIETNQKYFDVACERIRTAYQQRDLFVPAPSKVEQLELTP